MNEKEKLDYYNNNLDEIFNSNSISMISFIGSCLNDNKVRTSLKTWPNDIKMKIVDQHFIHIESVGLDYFGDNSWDDYYEMYDGKFDTSYKLVIKLPQHMRKEIEQLGYKFSAHQDQAHTPEIGEYSLDSNNNIFIIHLCPDREIFDVEGEQYLDELGINIDWTINVNIVS